MKNFFIYLSLALLFLTIENTLLRLLIPHFLIPDIILIMVFYLGFNRPSVEGALTTFVLGYTADVFSGGIIGLSSFTLLLVFIVTTMLSKILTLNSMLIKAGGVFFISILKGIIIYIAMRILNHGVPVYIIFSVAFSTGALGPLIINLLQKIEFRFSSFRGSNSLTNI